MKTSKVALSVVRIAVLLLGLGMVMPAGAQGQAETVTVAGWFHVIWGDGRPGTGITTESYFLTDDSGHTSPLRVDEETLRAAGGILALNQQRVIMEGDRLLAAPQGAGAAILHVQTIRRDDSAAASAAPAASPPVSGPQPWITIPCKFADVPSEKRDLAYFQGMYSSAYPGLDHYWREVSYDAINLTGSAAVGWHTLPQPKSYYVYDMDGDGQADQDLDRMANDCTAVADPDVYFPNYVGISLMFNDDIETCYGGSWPLTLDGIHGRWRMTWLADWGYYNVSVTAHEMGHGFGLPHSSGAYGMTYDNYWDVMSVTANCIWIGGGTFRDPVYGCLPQHTISFHKDILGWIPEARRRTVTAGERATIILEQLALPGDGNTLMARIPIADSATHFFTVEARRLTGYDERSPLPGQAVIIHEVDMRRERPAYVVDTDGNHNTGDGSVPLSVEIMSRVCEAVYDRGGRPGRLLGRSWRGRRHRSGRRWRRGCGGGTGG